MYCATCIFLEDSKIIIIHRVELTTLTLICRIYLSAEEVRFGATNTPVGSFDDSQIEKMVVKLIDSKLKNFTGKATSAFDASQIEEMVTKLVEAKLKNLTATLDTASTRVLCSDVCHLIFLVAQPLPPSSKIRCFLCLPGLEWSMVFAKNTH